MTVHLQLLGTPMLNSDGVPIRLRRRKAMALLSYLAVNRGQHQRETLATLLWPESDATAAHSSLRNLLWMLRETSLAKILRSDRSIVELLESETFTVDVVRFRELTRSCSTHSHAADVACVNCEPLLQDAVAMWRGRFMCGYTAVNSPLFEDWQLAEGEALNRELAEALDRLARYYLTTEDGAAAARCARLWTQTEPLNEQGYCLLMRALHTQGRRGEALQVYEECARVLSQQLGLRPGQAIEDVVARIRGTERSASMETSHRVSHLPQASVPLIGRQQMAEKIKKLLSDGTSRVVSLVGLGGAGKTSLALHVARQLEGHFDHGAVHVALESRRHVSSLAPDVSKALDLPMVGGESSEGDMWLARALKDRNLLIILDGAEHVVPQTAACIGALRDAPGVRVLVTSRVELSVQDEIMIPVQGLDSPPSGATLEEIKSAAAVRLLTIAAERHGTHLQLDESELRGMARLARLLEGSPLGLEMAAGWRTILAWDAIVDRVTRNLDFLVHRLSDVAPRHRTLAAVFEQSWELLPEAARVAMRKLSVFRSRFSIEAAESVAECSPSSLATLVNRSLLRRLDSNCYVMHELLRQFAADRLEDRDAEVSRVRLRYIDYYASAVKTWFSDLQGPNQVAALELMEGEIENVRSAFHMAIELGSSEQQHTFCEGMFCYYDMRTLLAEGAVTFGMAAERRRTQKQPDRHVDAFIRVAGGYFVTWDSTCLAAEMKAEGMDIFHAGVPSDRLQAMANIIHATSGLGEERGKNGSRLKGSIAYYKSQGDRRGEALALGAWAMVESYHDREVAETLACQSLRLHREIGDRWGEGLALHLLARLAEADKHYELALSRYEDAQRLNEPFTRGAFGVISTIIAQARMCSSMGRLRDSKRLSEEALRLSQESGYRFQIGRSLLELGRATRGLGQIQESKAHVEKAFSLLAQKRWVPLQVQSARILAEIALEEADTGSAKRWLHEAMTLDPGNTISQELAVIFERVRHDAKQREGNLAQPKPAEGLSVDRKTT